MMKKILTGLIMLGLFNIGTVLAADTEYDLTKINTGISQIESNTAKIVTLENSLAGLKIDSRANMWNFIGRSGNEKNIQKRSRIIREISALKDENSGISSKMLKNREIMYASLEPGLKDPGFCSAFEYLNSLAVAEALKTSFMDGKEIYSSSKTKERAEFLRYKRDMQDIRLRNMETLVKQFESLKKAYSKANQVDKLRVLEMHIVELGNKQAEGQKSQDAINNFLK
jgi:hypothetical protein